MTLAYAQRPIRDQKKHAVHAPEKGAGRQCGVALAIAERLQDRLGLGSREAVINAVFERIDSDRYLKYEFLGPEGFRSPPSLAEPEASNHETADHGHAANATS
jgi:hypothetical protein